MSGVAKQNSTTIKRGAQSVNKPRAKVRRPRKARSGSGSTSLDKLLVRLHITPARIRAATTVAILAAAIIAVGVVATWLGVPRMAKSAAAHQLARAGMVVHHIEIDGLNHMDRDTVNLIALDQYEAPMLNTDLTGVRDKLMAYGWVADAQVSRRWPDTLVISVQERQPAAVWQHDGALALVDGRGVVLQPVTVATMPTNLPLVIGPDANAQSAALGALLDRAARLKPLIASATWIGNRRWDLRFNTGEVLALPEGDTASAQALSAFADQDARHALLGRGYDRFDARDGSHLVVRLKQADALGNPATQPAVNGLIHGVSHG